MRWNERGFYDRLRAAAVQFDGEEVAACVRELLEHLGQRVQPYPADDARNILQCLRNKRHFAVMAQVADAFLRNGVEDEQVERQYGQALLDLGHIHAGLAVLTALQSRPNVSARERAEAHGLVGRAYKQIYVDAADSRVPANRKALNKAISAYLDVYRADNSKLWHGVNAASLLKRAARDGVDLSPLEADPLASATKIAEEIRREVDERRRSKEVGVWDLATAAEACIVLDRWRESGSYMLEYVQHPDADAFELASCQRQLQQVLLLDRDEGDERYLLDLVQSELLKRSGGSLLLRPDEVSPASDPHSSQARQDALQRVLGNTRYVSHSWLLQGLAAATSVARIWFRGLGHGSGFLLAGERLRSQWQGKQLLVTNSHVISTKPADWRTPRPSDVEVTFDALHGGGQAAPRFRVVENLWESPPTDLDVTVALLDGDPKPTTGYELCPAVPTSTESRIYVIGHPKGGDLAFSIQDNRFIASNDTFLQYRSPTDPGSSGSPVFDDQWRLIGIHHAGGAKLRRLDGSSESHAANEGILLARVRAALNA